MSRKGGAPLQKDAPWRASAGKFIPKIHHSPVLRLAQTPHSNYALAVMKHPDPIGSGLATEAIVEAAGPECIVPGQITPVRLLGVKVWPIEVNLKFLEPVGKELKLLGKMISPEAYGLMEDFRWGESKAHGMGRVDLELTIYWQKWTEGFVFMDDAVNLMNKSFIDR
ncbi:hypothetical protein SCA6_001750 [Theobroma cacao]